MGSAQLRQRAAALEVESVDPAAAVARSAMRRYFAELDERFGTAFAAGPLEHDGPFFVVVSDGAPIAAGGYRWIAQGTAEVKRMWVDRTWRGAGLGRRLLGVIEEAAAAAGAHRVVLDTRRALVEAIGMYERAGYREIERYNDNPHAELWFAKDLVMPRS